MDLFGIEMKKKYSGEGMIGSMIYFINQDQMAEDGKRSIKTWYVVRAISGKEKKSEGTLRMKFLV